MNAESLRSFLLWCTVFNYALLIVWFLIFLLARDRIYKMHGKIFRIPEERFNATIYAAMAFYKILIIVFNLIPYVALRMAG